MNIDITNLTVDQLKIKAYDETALLQNAERVVELRKNNLKVINQQIQLKLRESKMEEETPAVDETATEETPVEETAAPAEETPAEEAAPSEETPAEEAPASEEEPAA